MHSKKNPKRDVDNYKYSKLYIYSEDFYFRKYLNYAEFLIRKFIKYLGFDIYKTVKFYILSYPRSGNHLVRFLIESLSGQPTLGAQNGKSEFATIFSIDKPIYKKINIKINTKKPIGIKRHHFDKYNETGFELDLLLILRNPIEAIFSHKINQLTEKFDIQIINDEFKKYCELLKIYHSSNKNKIIFYYSDLIENDKNTLQNLKNFLKNYSFDIKNLDTLSNDIAFNSLERESQTINVHNLLDSIDDKIYKNLENQFYQDIKKSFPLVNTDKLFSR